MVAMTHLIRVLVLLSAGPARRRVEAWIIEAHARDLDDEVDVHAGAVLRGRAAQLRAWRPA
jgi:hypothetical protein